MKLWKVGCKLRQKGNRVHEEHIGMVLTDVLDRYLNPHILAAVDVLHSVGNRRKFEFKVEFQK